MQFEKIWKEYKEHKERQIRNQMHNLIFEDNIKDELMNFYTFLKLREEVE